MNKVTTITQALESVQDGMTVMIGGFLAVGTPELLVDALLAKGTKDLTVIANDTAFPDKGIGKLVVNRRLQKAIVSHIGTNPETGRQMNAGELQVELVPQGTLAERIRAGGAGLGGILTPTGLGTIIAEGKDMIVIDGREYLLEKYLKADVALIKAHTADTAGNLLFHRSARNFNPLMAMAAGTVIVQAENIVEAGHIDPDQVMTPGIVVDWIVRGEGKE
ncbi:acetate CoA/acetoacetate CoA-transferase alpha subunit [Anaerospora hongkongensis]|uniref:Acetate CoA/acetoacetate CoA-transferase alpha subunit n=1 Tax=Anaerospora hongkongensis TaxID=244830 RepID=A0A4R1Q056_9FIRM|nr:acetate CoA-transferase subunit alpha [Anaerospora hongkongensis]TCL38703.1 acetate CoA/acetoacetate CoA-transferase alpha subunit [Anaerospora hongkongensis]